MGNPIAQLAHLARRFFGHVAAHPLRPAEQDEVSDALPPELALLFFRQQPADQRHALEVARRIRGVRPDDHDAFVAALVHDVGKGETPIGAAARSMATVLDALHLPMSRAWRRYRNHGPLGAAALETAGASPLAVAFARHHPGPIPNAVDPTVWAALCAADHT